MCEHLGSQFLRTTNGIQSGPNAEIKIGYLFNHLHSYSNIKQFEINSKGQNR